MYLNTRLLIIINTPLRAKQVGSLLKMSIKKSPTLIGSGSSVTLSTINSLIHISSAGQNLFLIPFGHKSMSQ